MAGSLVASGKTFGTSDDTSACACVGPCTTARNNSITGAMTFLISLRRRCKREATKTSEISGGSATRSTAKRAAVCTTPASPSRGICIGAAPLERERSGQVAEGSEVVGGREAVDQRQRGGHSARERLVRGVAEQRVEPDHAARAALDAQQLRGE